MKALIEIMPEIHSTIRVLLLLSHVITSRCSVTLELYKHAKLHT